MSNVKFTPIHFIINSFCLIAVCVFLSVSSSSCYGQTKEVKLIAKGKYAQAEKKILKSLSKDSVNVFTLYSYSNLMNERAYTLYNTRQAYLIINKAICQYNYNAGTKDQARLDKAGLNKPALLNYREKIFDNALSDAITVHTIDAYQGFIDLYKESEFQKAEAKRLRNIIAFSIALEENTEKAYQNFLATYPSSTQRDSAILLRDTRAFENAQKENTSVAYKSFMIKYPNSTFYKQVNDLYENALFVEQTDGTLDGYMKFCRSYPRSKFIDKAIDSIYCISSRTLNVGGLDFIIKSYPRSTAFNNAREFLINLLLYDGEYSTVNYLNNTYKQNFTTEQTERINNAEFIALAGRDLYPNIGVNEANKTKYEDFIRYSVPNEYSWVCLQRLIEPSIRSKKWTEAVSILDAYKLTFSGTEWLDKIEKTINLLSAGTEGVKVISVAGVNTDKEEYSPVPSFDDKHFYFCGKDRPDCIGGEDIFEANRIKGVWGKPSVVSDLSTSNRNEAPLSLSADGNTMLLWSSEGSGDILYSEKTSSGGWSAPKTFPWPINTDYYEGDAMLTADGRSLLFVSTRPEGRNLFTVNPDNYHGDKLYPTDIYVCTMDEYGRWGEPVNLGPDINTLFSERTPFLHPDGKTLYFSSDGHYGLGRMDVFKTEKLDENSWTQWKTPENMGKEINSPDSDWGFKFSTDGKTVYYSGGKSVSEPSSLLLLLDISGSMAGDKIGALKMAATDVCLNALSNNSEIAIFTFNGTCNFPVNYWTGFSKDASYLTSFILSLYADGGTPMYEAMQVACQYMKKNKSRESKNQSIILLTDGDENGCQELKNTLAYLRANGMLYRFQTIAFEVSEYSRAYSDLQTISTTTKGSFFHAQTVDDLGTAFAEASTSLYNFSASSKKDILQFNLPDNWRPDYVATVSGKLIDRQDNAVSATIKWEDLATGKQMGESKSDPVDGSYFIILPLGRIYGYYIDKPGVFPSSNNLDLRDQDQKVDVEVNVGVVTFQEMIDEQIPVPINNIFFETAMYNLKSESFPELNRLVKIIIDNSEIKVEIAGHTDNVGTEDYNQELSEKRARAVADYLIKQGAKPDHIIVVGYGFSKPVADNETEDGRKKNRRVEFRFVK